MCASAPIDFGVESTSENCPALGDDELYSKWHQGQATPSLMIWFGLIPFLFSSLCIIGVTRCSRLLVSH